MYIQFSNVDWNGNAQYRCRQAAIGFEYCRRLVLSNVTIAENTAKFAGGVFTAYPRKIIVTCDLDHPGNNATFQEIFQKQLNNTGKLDRENDLLCLNISQNALEVKISPAFIP